MCLSLLANLLRGRGNQRAVTVAGYSHLPEKGATAPLPSLSSTSFGAAKSGCQLHDLWRVICVRMRKLRHNLFVQPDRVGNGNGEGGTLLLPADK